jgi:hypothetical protein
LGCEESAYCGGLSYTAVTRGKMLRNLYFFDVPETDEALLARMKANSKNGCGNEKMQGSERQFARNGDTKGVVAGEEFVIDEGRGGTVNGL